MLPLETAEHATFAPLVGQSFHVTAPGTSVSLELTDVRMLGQRHPTATRDPFALHFLGARGLRLSQGIHRFENPVLGTMEIFISQTGMSARGSEFEAVFT